MYNPGLGLVSVSEIPCYRFLGLENRNELALGLVLGLEILSKPGIGLVSVSQNVVSSNSGD